MCCAICNQPLSPAQPTVPTTTGEVVHRICADQQARAAYARRCHAALGHAAVLAAIVVLLVGWGLTVWALLGLVIGSALHWSLHRHLWLMVMLRWRMRRGATRTEGRGLREED